MDHSGQLNRRKGFQFIVAQVESFQVGKEGGVGEKSGFGDTVSVQVELSNKLQFLDVGYVRDLIGAEIQFSKMRVLIDEISDCNQPFIRKSQLGEGKSTAIHD